MREIRALGRSKAFKMISPGFPCSCKGEDVQERIRRRTYFRPRSDAKSLIVSWNKTEKEDNVGKKQPWQSLLINNPSILAKPPYSNGKPRKMENRI